MPFFFKIGIELVSTCIPIMCFNRYKTKNVDIQTIDIGILTAKDKCLGNVESFGNHVGMSSLIRTRQFPIQHSSSLPLLVLSKKKNCQRCFLSASAIVITTIIHCIHCFDDFFSFFFSARGLGTRPAEVSSESKSKLIRAIFLIVKKKSFLCFFYVKILVLRSKFVQICPTLS